MKSSIIILLLIVNITDLIAQNGFFSEIPLRGKIKTYKQYDNEGKLTQYGEVDSKGGPVRWWNSEGDDTIQSKTIYKNDSILNFYCFCANIDSLIKEFKFKINKEIDYKNQSSLLLDIEVLNPKGLISSKFNFNYGGYYEEKTVYFYDDSNKLIEEKYFDKFDTITGKTVFLYDKNGLLIEKKYNSVEDDFGERTEMVTDSNQYIKSLRKFNQNVLTSESKWEIITDSNIQKTICFNDSFPKGYLERITIFDNKWKKIKVSELNSKGIETERVEKEYYRNNNLKSITYYREDNILISTIKYKYDKRGNCNLVIVQFYDKKTGKNKKVRYKQVITYYE
jgi:hypothetical protein